VAELTLHRRSIQTLFDLLGDKEDDITYSLGWGLAQSEAFARALLSETFGDAEQGEISAIRLQEASSGTGRTDLEIETEHLHLVLEAKRGWNLPLPSQLQQYAKRLNKRDDRRGRIVVVAECAPYYPPVLALPNPIDDVPVSYMAWKRIAELAAITAAASHTHAEKRLLLELHRYLKGLMTMQNVTSNMVFVVVLGQDPLRWSTLTFKDTVMKRGFYYHPMNGKGWPHTPPNYIAFRFDGRLQQVRHIDDYEVVTRPHEHIPEIIPEADWSDEPHFLYTLGPPIVPNQPVANGKIWPNARLWCALDLLLSCETIGEARDKTRERLANAGETGG
jgi:hypothetical protein